MKHTHRGRPIWKRIGINQWQDKLKCRKCEVIIIQPTQFKILYDWQDSFMDIALSRKTAMNLIIEGEKKK